MKPVSLTLGQSVTLNPGVTQIQGYVKIEWRFGNERIARIKEINGLVSMDYNSEWKFRGRLHLNNYTGSLTITNVGLEHTGVYELSITIGNEESVEIFSVNVYTPLPVPTIVSYCHQNPISKCSVLCSVLNVSAVSLSWYKGNSLLSSISVSDLSISLSLPLEVEFQDKNTYSCVVNNPTDNRTQHLDPADLSLSSDSVHCYDTTIAVIRLVTAILMVVAAGAAVVVLGLDVKSRI
ncbi:uncharacterized protein LOC130216710 [Danio aesculapii]|uniref:uncharacterized protein LOC130216710 n=1 Tax=Danio aesculapii TaxID=1142201 RepID=UPI0024C0745B|nr:uncharacterized protein LOC130216710 [Danio aesculapii]